MSDALRLAAAMATLLVGGCGAALLVLPSRRPVAPAEVLGFGYLMGAALVSLLSFSAGLFLSGLALRIVVTLVCAALFAAGLARSRRPDRWALARADIIAAAAPLLPGFALGWLALRLPMAWDGVMTWEQKARMAWLNGGGLPLPYLAQPYRYHADYPPLVPLLEAWVYGWLGHVDQVRVKLVFAGFLLSVLWLLAAAARRFGLGAGWCVLAVLLPLCVPRLILGEGSATSGYADFPLAAAYFACVVLLITSGGEDAPGALRAAGLLAAALPWTKQEGVILWLAVVLFALAIARRERHYAALAWVVVPALLVVIGWRTVLAVSHAALDAVFVPVTAATLSRNFPRVGMVAAAALRYAASGEWSLLWPVAAVSAAVAAWRVPKARDVVAVLVAAVAVPAAVYSSIYIFSAADPAWHIATSLQRLMIQVSLPAVLLVIVPALGQGGRYNGP